MTNSTTPYNYTQGAADLQSITIDQAACYAQTFGGIGFASHMPTYYLPRWGCGCLPRPSEFRSCP